MIQKIGMKIIFLNTWNGKMREGIADFLREQSADTDMFCLQEAYDGMREMCHEILSDFTELTAYKFVVADDDFPMATYVRKGIEILSSETVFDGVMDCGLGICMHVRSGNVEAHICNVHGLSKPGNKLDNPDRLKQSRGLIDFFRDKNGSKIIGGDFNLFPDTESIRMFSEYGYRNLIAEYEIKTTRNRLAWEMYPDSKQLFSDYVFVSSDTDVTRFEVPDNEIADHLPLVLEIGEAS